MVNTCHHVSPVAVQWEYDGKLPLIVSLGTTSRLSGNQLHAWKMTGAQLAFYLLLVSGTVSLLEVNVGSVPGRR